MAEISKVFLLPGQVYSDDVVSSLLRNILFNLNKEKIIFDDRAFSLTREIVTEYSSTSYGNPLFTDFILIYLQMQHSPDFRKIIWNELGSVLKLVFPSKNFQLSLDAFFYPIESDSSVIQSIVSSFSNPWYISNFFLRKIAIHHLAGTLFEDFGFDGTLTAIKTLSDWNKQTIYSQIPQELKNEILYYFPAEIQRDDMAKVIEKRKLQLSNSA